MHCPHKSVNQTSLSWCYWCLAATGAAVSAVANRPRYSRLRSLMNQDSSVRFNPAIPSFWRERSIYVACNSTETRDGRTFDIHVASHDDSPWFRSLCAAFVRSCLLELLSTLRKLTRLSFLFCFQVSIESRKNDAMQSRYSLDSSESLYRSTYINELLCLTLLWRTVLEAAAVIDDDMC